MILTEYLENVFDGLLINESSKIFENKTKRISETLVARGYTDKLVENDVIEFIEFGKQLITEDSDITTQQVIDYLIDFEIAKYQRSMITGFKNIITFSRSSYIVMHYFSLHYDILHYNHSTKYFFQYAIEKYLYDLELDLNFINLDNEVEKSEVDALLSKLITLDLDQNYFISVYLFKSHNETTIVPSIRHRNVLNYYFEATKGSIKEALIGKFRFDIHINDLELPGVSD